MAAAAETILRPRSHGELFAEWARFPDAIPWAGGTTLISERAEGRGGAGPAILSLEGIDDLRKIDRSERFIEIGAAVSLSRVAALGRFVPGTLVECLLGVGGPLLRNMATIGGNVCGGFDASAALPALDAQYEIRDAQSARWVAASRFAGIPFDRREILTRIRVPLDGWDVSAYAKFAGTWRSGRSAVFLARVQKDVLTDIRVVCKSPLSVLRDRDAEMLLAGKRLPLTRRMAASFAAHWRGVLDSAVDLDPPSRRDAAGFIEANVVRLAE